jgi:hypothetical protein
VADNQSESWPVRPSQLKKQNRMPTPFAHHLAGLKPLLVSSPPLVSDDQFDRIARELFSTQFESIPPYRRFCQARGLTPVSIRHWSRIPAVPTTTFKEFDWTSIPSADRSRVFLSSGTTTETRSRHFHDASSLGLYERSLLAWASTWLFPNHQERIPILFLTPPPPDAPNSSLVHMFETLRRAWGTEDSAFAGRCDSAGLWTLSSSQSHHVLKQSEACARPIAIFGTAFSFVELLDQLSASQTRVELPPGSRILETGGYKGRSRVLPRSELYARLTDALGIPGAAIVSEYGMCELSSQAYDHAVGSLESDRSFRFPPWARALVINPNTDTPAAPGETGLLRVFDLANVWSVLAIQTEDLAYPHHDGFALVGRAVAAEARGCSLLSR